MKKKRSILKELIKVARYENSPYAFMIRIYSVLAMFQTAIAVISADYRVMFQVMMTVSLIFFFLVFRGIERRNRYCAYLGGKARGMNLLMHMAMKAKEAKEQEGGEL